MVAPFTDLPDGDAENLIYLVLSGFITRLTLPGSLFTYIHTCIFILFSDSSLSSTHDKDDLFSQATYKFLSESTRSVCYN